ncbi:MAG: class I SAM-dependent methyltransferase [Chloroflexota bacterium]|nr:class I SAM-dependent methyltransferase [Chloroflexota bacterium]
MSCDLGTGDGRSVVRAARKRPDVLFIGLDADPTRMRRASQHAPGNALFVVAGAEGLPIELDGAIAELSVCFPWGSLLRGLVTPSPALLGGLARVLQPGGTFRALLSITTRDGGTPLGPGSIDRGAYACSGLRVEAWRRATAIEVAASESSWAKRLRAGDARPVWWLQAVSIR